MDKYGNVIFQKDENYKDVVEEKPKEPVEEIVKQPGLILDIENKNATQEGVSTETSATEKSVSQIGREVLASQKEKTFSFASRIKTGFSNLLSRAGKQLEKFNAPQAEEAPVKTTRLGAPHMLWDLATGADFEREGFMDNAGHVLKVAFEKCVDLEKGAEYLGGALKDKVSGIHERIQKKMSEAQDNMMKRLAERRERLLAEQKQKEFEELTEKIAGLSQRIANLREARRELEERRSDLKAPSMKSTGATPMPSAA